MAFDLDRWYQNNLKAITGMANSLLEKNKTPGLEPCDLAQELYLKLKQSDMTINDEEKLMRNLRVRLNSIRIDWIRAINAKKRGGKNAAISLTEELESKLLARGFFYNALNEVLAEILIPRPENESVWQDPYAELRQQQSFLKKGDKQSLHAWVFKLREHLDPLLESELKCEIGGKHEALLPLFESEVEELVFGLIEEEIDLSWDVVSILGKLARRTTQVLVKKYSEERASHNGRPIVRLALGDDRQTEALLTALRQWFHEPELQMAVRLFVMNALEKKMTPKKLAEEFKLSEYQVRASIRKVKSMLAECGFGGGHDRQA